MMTVEEKNALAGTFVHNSAHPLLTLDKPTQVYYLDDGRLLLISQDEAGKPITYLHDQLRIRHSPHRLHQWRQDKGWMQPLRMKQFGEQMDTEESKPSQPAIVLAYPQLPLHYVREIIHLSEFNHQLKAAHWICHHPKILARDYPLAYIILLAWHPEPKKVKTWLEDEAGLITTRLLARLLDVPSLTSSQRRLIRHIRPTIWPHRYGAALKSMLSHWHAIEPKMAKLEYLSDFDVENYLYAINKYPFLTKASWFGLHNSDVTMEMDAVMDYLRHQQMNERSIEQKIVKGIKSDEDFSILYAESEVFYEEHELHTQYPDDKPLPTTENIKCFLYLPFSEIKTVGELRKIGLLLDNCASSFAMINEVFRNGNYLYAYRKVHDLDGKLTEEIGLLELNGQRLRDLWSFNTNRSYEEWQGYRVVTQFFGTRNCPMSAAAQLDLKEFLTTAFTQDESHDIPF